MTRSYIVVDLDTTLADNTHREHLAVSKQWDAFHEAMADDGVYEDVFALLGVFGARADNPNIVFLTARDEKYHTKTLKWLEKKVHQFIPELYMRDRPHHEETAGDFKLRKLREFSERWGKPLFCLEDQMNITLQLRAEGFVVWNVRNSHA